MKVIEMKECDDMIQTEMDLHNKYKNNRMMGEWFKIENPSI